MFSGTHPYSMDKKGRVSIPSQFREIMQKSGDHEIVLTISPTGDYHYLLAMPRSEWEPVAVDVEKDPLDQEARNRRRFLMARMEICTMDRQGRILIPPRLRDYAGLTKEVDLVGAGKSFEIWDRQIFEKHFDELIVTYSEKGLKSQEK